ncbi:Proline utilization trans-activator [Colletotrichum orbiculare MAFF 240422]|uniref:Proline utilization trans-activator n=1 Tax=Colletotrichum orbiculare (strain 104-T / ATCC 96160 / CBS 514.97 / LARS 414 / MAFF 240422) TaxID=1213857 RepID=N4V4J1_COLOR|nr:Proline utilization trans-activator [Colletotrichum orbiculare MAFF 240422]
MPQQPAGKQRSANACNTCRRRKVKCSGEQPCRNCVRNKLDCEFGAGRQRYSEAYVQELRATVTRYETQIRELKRESPIPGSSTDGVALENTLGIEPPTPSGDVPPPPSYSSIERAPGPLFERRVRNLFHADANKDPDSPEHDPSEGHAHDAARDAPFTAEWNSTEELIRGIPAPSLPSEAESHRLLELFVSDMCITQHFLDQRTFIDNMTMLFQSPSARVKQMNTPWFTQYLLVMAMGKLVESQQEINTEPPGAAYFAEAMRRLPPLHSISEYGIVAVEILCLTTTYVQWCDRKNEAYFFIGTAVRLALTLGCNLPFAEQQCLPSERAHRTRVWWTAYMLDQRISAALGLPASVDDRQISFDLPGPAPGFGSPEALNVSVRIARATGEIMTSLYSNGALSQGDLVKKMRSILQSLYDTGRSIPAELSIDFKDKDFQVTRAGSALYLRLFAAIILCIRPILLQKVKDKVQATQKDITTPALSQLCLLCNEAALRTIRILTAMQQQEVAAPFAFFDLDAAFSAAFVLIMRGFAHKNDSQKPPPPELLKAMEVLEYLSDAGNKAAAHRLKEVRQFACHVWARAHFPPAKDDDVPMLEAAGSHEAPQAGEPNGMELAGRSRAASMGSQQAVVSPPDPSPSTQPSWDGEMFGRDGSSEPYGSDMLFGLDLNSSLGQDFSLEAEGIYASFNDPNLPLTGVDQLDWAELEKMMATGLGS